ncbi:MAG: pitrilysin family protein [Burkholderiaceae bacterium]|jgi:zinc protease
MTDALKCKIAAFAAVWLFWPALGAGATAPETEVLRSTLANGLRVVIVRNTLAPVVATALNYLVGADETPAGFPGTAHAQEHMMFRGSPGLTADQLADLGSIMGGSFNANTRQTVTQYLYTVPSADLDVALHIEALRMRGVLDNQKDWQQERGAIEQEVAQDLSNPQYVLYTRLREALFQGTPYAHDALGTRPSFDRTSAAMLKKFHDRWYAPNNAILIVAGDVELQPTLNEIKELFGSIPKKTLPSRPSIDLKPFTSQSMTLATDLPFAMEVMALRMPGLQSPDFPALEVLSDVLSSQRGALYQLVPQGKAISAGFSFDPLPKAAIGTVTIGIPASADPAPVQAEIRRILTQIAQEGVPAELVDAAKLQERRAAELQKNSIEGLASEWADALAVDGLDSPDEDLERIEKVTVEDVNRVARKYLDPNQSIVARLTPQGSGRPVASTGFGGQESINLGEAKDIALPSWADAAVARLTVPPSVLHPTVTRLANGLTLIVQPEQVSHTVSVYGHIRNRPELEVPVGKEGLTQVLDQLLTYGTEHLDRLAYQSALDEIGADEQAGTDFQVSVLRDHFERAVELLAANELTPALPEDAFQIVRQQVSDTLAGRIKSPGFLTGRAIRTALFPKDDPTLRDALPQTVASVALDDVKTYREHTFRPDLTVIVVIGDVTPEAAQAVIEKYFGQWSTSGPKPNTTLPPVPPNVASVVGVPDSSRVQDEVTLAETLGLTRSSADVYALRLGNNVLGGGFYSTRLSRDLRKDAGLVYSVGSELEFGKSRSVYFVQYACDPKNVEKVHASVVHEIETMQKTPVTPTELQRSKAMLLRQIPLEEASLESIAQGIIRLWDLELPLDEPTIAARHYVELTGAEIQDAFAKWLRPHDLARVTQGPAT